MFYMEEFEIFENEGIYIALPFDFDGGTQGENMRDASEMAYDWMRSELEYRLMRGEDIPESTVGNKPTHGGRIVLLAMKVNLTDVETVNAATAAEMLGVTRGRVSQLFKAGSLLGYKRGRDLFITVDSIHARLGSDREDSRTFFACAVN